MKTTSRSRFSISPWKNVGWVVSDWDGLQLHFSIAILGLVFDAQNALVWRSSDAPWVLSRSSLAYDGPLPPMLDFLQMWERLMVPTGYQTQMELPPGEYRVVLALTDGQNFGRATASLSLARFPLRSLGHQWRRSLQMFSLSF